MAIVGGLSSTEPLAGERRNRHERRRRRAWSLLYGSFYPRRRGVRRNAEQHVEFVDWHDAHLFAAALAVVLLSSIDAFMTLMLLVHGAQEVNPVMAGLLYQNVASFAAVKMALTGLGVMTLVILSRCRVFGRIRVDLALYLTLAGYLALVSYEYSLLDRAV
jgi:hypothetical protein